MVDEKLGENSPNPLEEAIRQVAEGEGRGEPDEALVEARREVLKALAMARVAVLTESPTEAGAPPKQGTPLLFVTDGENQQQPMLALFTSADCAQRFHGEAGGEFSHPAEVPAPWALLQLPAEAGLMINPNLAPSFRIGPEVAKLMRETTEDSLANSSSQQPSDVS